MENYKRASISILVNSKGQILLQLRDNNPDIISPNHWGFIGGGVEDGETELDAIKRETVEEIGIDIADFHYLDKFYIEEHKILVYLFIARLDVLEEEIIASEGQGVKFFYPRETEDLKIVEILKEMIHKHSDDIHSIANRLNASQ